MSTDLIRCHDRGTCQRPRRNRLPHHRLMIKMTYTLGDHGWAFIDAELGPARIRFSVSYMSHALEDVVSATVSSLSGQPVVRFALIDEPGSFCWVLARNAELLQITVVHVDSMFAVEKFNKLPVEP